VPDAFDDAVTFRIRATSDSASKPVFIGVGRTADVEAYLAGVDHDVVTDVDDNPFEASYRHVDGTAVRGGPGSQTFWMASTSGTGTRDLQWNPNTEDWTAVIMNADGSRRVATHADLGVRVGWLVQIAIGFLVVGAAFVLGGIILWFAAVRPARMR